MMRATPEKPVTAFYLEERYKDYQRECAYPAGASPAEIERWREALARELRRVFTLDILGIPPTPSYQVLSKTEEERYTRLLIAYEVLSGNWVQAHWLLPRKLPAPAVLCLHGHFLGGKDSVVFPDKAAGMAFGHELASRGFVVLAPDGAGLAARDQWGRNARDVPPEYSIPPREGGCELLFRRLNHMGIDTTGFRVFELMAAINMLERMPEVKGGIGCAGLSGGCWLAQVLTAMDARIRASVLSGYFTTFAQTAWLGHCVCHHPFGIGKICDMPDITALAAPRPQCIEAGSEDVNYPVEPAFTQAMAAYKDHQAENQLVLHRFSGGHRFEGTRSVPWLCEQLLI
jgi:dienelactone hydrolase